MLVVKTTSPATSPSPANVQPEKDVPSSRTTSARFCLCLSFCFKPCSCSIVNKLAADHRTHHAPLELPPEVWAVGRPTDHRTRPNRPLLGEVHERQIRRSPRKHPAVATVLNPTARRASHCLDEAREREPSALHQLHVEHRECRLVPQKARRSLLQRKLLLGGRRIIKKKKQNDNNTTPQSLPDLKPVVIRPQRRVDPVKPLQCADQLVGEGQMVWRGVSRHVRPPLKEAKERRREPGAHVGYVNLRPGLRRQYKRRRRRYVLGTRW